MFIEEVSKIVNPTIAAIKEIDIRTFAGRLITYSQNYPVIPIALLISALALVIFKLINLKVSSSFDFKIKTHGTPEKTTKQQFINQLTKEINEQSINISMTKANIGKDWTKLPTAYQIQKAKLVVILELQEQYQHFTQETKEKIQSLNATVENIRTNYKIKSDEFNKQIRDNYEQVIQIRDYIKIIDKIECDLLPRAELHVKLINLELNDDEDIHTKYPEIVKELESYGYSAARAVIDFWRDKKRDPQHELFYQHKVEDFRSLLSKLNNKKDFMSTADADKQKKFLKEINTQIDTINRLVYCGLAKTKTSS